MSSTTPESSSTRPATTAGDAPPRTIPGAGAGVELPKAYKPSEHEDAVWQRWVHAGAFHAEPARVLRGEAKPYSVFIPPPNVTAALHLGHALNNTIQDVLVRAHRMMGFEALWMPGTDHAGIATQAVVEKRVMKEEKKRRSDFTREAFVAKIQAFKDEYEAVITGQLQKMGCSCDWDRQRFTMDEQCAAAVREAFFLLFRDGLIYRGKRLVNWDPALQTAVADDECYDEEIDGHFYYLRYPLVHALALEPGAPHAGAGKGHTHDVDPKPVTWDELAARGYPGASEHPADQQAWITVATTRPETYLGDTAVAINPHDPRAKSLRGLFVELPLVGRVIPIIEDAYVVLPERYARDEDEKNDPKAKMATGFLKVTPAHDPNDYEIGQRHRLPMVNMMGPDGRVSDKHGWTDVGDAHLLVGLPREKARAKVVDEFKARGLFEGSKPTRHSVKHSDRSKAIVEPYLSDQWYVKVTDPRMAPAANAVLHKKDLEFFPPRYAKTYEQWHDNIRDWCISRQLWWGHRIPVWTNEHRSHSLASLAQLDQWKREGRIAADLRSPSFAEGLAGTVPDKLHNVCVRDDADTEVITFLEANGFVRDPDVLDTWFSSALWPLSTLGWPDPTKFNAQLNAGLLDAFNPSSVLCTAREIITLWVSRMVMFNGYLKRHEGTRAQGHRGSDAQSHDSVPFHHVYIHAVIQDGEGRKMSKSLGNGVDPLDIIATHGADAMRFTLCHMATNTQDVRMPVVKDPSGKNTSPKFDLGRNFANKLWNASRFALGMIPAAGPTTASAVRPSDLALIDRWMLSRLHAGVRGATASLEAYQFNDYAQGIYDLVWRDFCDWYLEGIKPTIAASPAQQAVLNTCLNTLLRLVHPVMPFVSETLFAHASAIRTASVEGVALGPSRKGGLLCTAGWPIVQTTLHDGDAEAQFERLRGLVATVRDARAAQQVKPARKVTLHVPAGVALGVDEPLLKTFANVGEVTQAPAPPAGSAACVWGAVELKLSNLHDAPLAGAGEGADAVKAAQVAQLRRAEADALKLIATLRGRLQNPGYTDRAPPAMVQQTRDQLAKAESDLAAARKALQQTGN